MKSRWEQTKQKSTYHFNAGRCDLKDDVLENLGYFAPTAEWAPAVEHIIKSAKPATWATRGYKGQGREIPAQDLTQEHYDLESAGYSRDHKITNLCWDIPPVFQRIANSFDLSDVMIRIHVQHPGETWNLHIDKLEKWCPENPNRVQRIFVQLTDWQPGQFWEFGNYHWRRWLAGDAVTFDWQNMPHATANAGYHPRVTMQITGIKTA